MFMMTLVYLKLRNPGNQPKQFVFFFIDWLIDWCLMSTLASFQLYHGMNKFYVILDSFFPPINCTIKYIPMYLDIDVQTLSETHNATPATTNTIPMYVSEID